MIGIIHSIMRLVDSWRASAAGIVVIFCIRNIDSPTSTGSIIGDGSAEARSSHRKRLLMGTTAWTGGSHE